MDPLLSTSTLNEDTSLTSEELTQLNTHSLPDLSATSEPDLYQVFYQSQAAPFLPTLQQLRAILDWSRSYNATHQITGLLLCTEGQFLQLLEGPKAEVCALFASIKNDRRHRRVRLVRERTITSRHFPQWHMGVGYVSAAELAKVVTGVQGPASKRTLRFKSPHVQRLWQAVRS
jgi:hypothetical protein